MYWYKSYFIEEILLSMMWKVLAVMGLGGGAFLIYKMMKHTLNQWKVLKMIVST